MTKKIKKGKGKMEEGRKRADRASVSEISSRCFSAAPQQQQPPCYLAECQ